MRRFRWILGLTVALLPLAACDDDGAADDLTEPVVDSAAMMIAEIQEGFPNSLHATAAGMRDWYDHPDGFGAMIGVDYETLPCGNCHVPPTGEGACATCHDDVQAAAAGTEVMDTDVTCVKACHGRQRSEIGMGLPDVHREAGMDCTDCHTSEEIHGDGEADATMFDEGVLTTSCDDCHVAGGGAPLPPDTRAHRVHGDDLSCQSCHMANGVSCYNCHFADEVENHKKVAYTKFADWVFLGNYRGQVYPMNFQSVEYQGQTYNAWGPFHGHTITQQGRDCRGCHINENVLEYGAEGELKVVHWDADQNKLVNLEGIIPVPPDWSTSLLFDYVTKDGDGSGWRFLETGPDKSHMRFATPLTSSQMDELMTGR